MLFRSAACALLFAAGAPLLLVVSCSDGDTRVDADAGPDGTTVRPPPPPPPVDPNQPPPDGIDRTERMGNAALVGDVGAPTDGPSWHAPEGALYFTSAGRLHKLVPGGAVTPIAYDDGGAPIGTAIGGGRVVYATERTTLATLTPDGDGGVSIVRRPGPAGAGLLGDITHLGTDALYFVDVTGSRGFVFRPNGGGDPQPAFDGTIPYDGGAPRATAIAAGVLRGESLVLVGFGGGPEVRTSIVVYRRTSDGSLEVKYTVPLPGTPPNGLALDESGVIYVAWARGIDIYTLSESSGGIGHGSSLSPGLPLAATPTSLAFGGGDRKTLFVTTAAGKIYAVPARSAGFLR